MAAADIGSCAPEKPIIEEASATDLLNQKPCFVEQDTAESRWGVGPYKINLSSSYGIGLEFPQMVVCMSDGTFFCKQIIAKTNFHDSHLIILISSRANKNGDVCFIL